MPSVEYSTPAVTKIGDTELPAVFHDLEPCGNKLLLLNLTQHGPPWETQW